MEVDRNKSSTSNGMLRLDLDKQLVKLKVAHVDIRFRHLVSSLPTGPTLLLVIPAGRCF